MGKRGPKKIEINWEEFEKLCAFHCTQEEICYWFNVDHKTLDARVNEAYGVKFSQLFRQKRSKGKISLRRSQMQNALGGNTSMQIWLGKQYLEQKDKTENETTLSGRDGKAIDLSVNFVDPAKDNEDGD